MPDDSSGMVFRSVYVDPAVDDAVVAHADRLAASKGAIFRLVLDAGLAQLDAGAVLPAAREVVPALRTVYLAIEVDELVRVLAYELRLPRDELTQRLGQLGAAAVFADLTSQKSTP